MAVFTLVGPSMRQPGVYTFGPVTIPDGLSHVVLAIDRTGMSALSNTVECLRWTYQLSYDNGSTWTPPDWAATMGGNYLVNGVTRTESTTSFDIPLAVNRQVKGQLDVFTRLQTSFTATMT